MLLLGAILIVLHAVGHWVIAMGLQSLLLLMFAFFYYKSVPNRDRFFLLFLIFIAFGNFLDFADFMLRHELPDDPSDLAYLIVNSILIIGHFFLAFKIIKVINFKKLITEYPITLLVLIIMNVSLVAVVNSTINYFFSGIHSVLEFTYNLLIMFLLSLALLKYMSTYDRRSMNLLLAMLFLMMAEVVLIINFYIVPTDSLSAIQFVIWLLAFVFFYFEAISPSEVIKEDDLKQDLLI